MDTTTIRKRLSDSKLVKQSTQFYHKYQRWTPAVSFTAGFAWDNFTLTRIDVLSDNLIMLAYLIGAGVFIALINFIEEKIITNRLLTEYSLWYPTVVQFFFGGLFSSYFVFYFRSAAFAKNWLFLLLLLVVLIGNEFIENRLTNMKLQFSLYFMAVFSFFIFFMPILLHAMNVWVFLFSGFLSLVPGIGLAYFIFRKNTRQDKKQFQSITAIILSIFVLLNILYFLNWIPPVPLSLKDSGIYHHVHRQDDRYIAKFEKGSWYHFWKNSDDIYHYEDGDTVFCYAAVFAPTRLDKKIIHHWQLYNNNQSEWLTTDRMSYEIRGGRDGGYRGYSYKKNIQPGEWRVDVKTEQGQLLGRINFDLIAKEDKSVALKSVIK